MDTKQHILDYISVYYASNGIMPTYRDIAKGIGMGLTNVTHHLHALKKEGKITFQDGKPRTIVILENQNADTEEAGASQ